MGLKSIRVRLLRPPSGSAGYASSMTGDGATLIPGYCLMIPSGCVAAFSYRECGFRQ
ncbi:hypothetical protein CA85_10310 [Allorhodopirellula solitaria]|uniref:Uncharacterized protein n=1 Tax=Allorhodopirellula solitaria TaxID=2527987 RepID=A0A5C5YGA1_9BACT|nr:hypothetical protein CA85_10310 [Allorhodopirellula solitaria]